ncbi:MAG TPA: hypothetical protein DEF36_02200 [Desulfotomaculum sp.]|nr:hypothetical protein [Desulfotomaculum sp.]
MGRRMRVEYKNGITHVIQRGNNREFVFGEDADKNYLIGQLSILSRDMGYWLYGYAIMGNHYHLIVQIRAETLRSVMHRINLRYSKYFNRKYQRTGHVFEGRYRAIPVVEEKYMVALLRYIHQNPVKAGICRSVEEYIWSSDRYYRENIQGCVEIDLVLDMLSGSRKAALEKYKEFMAQEETGNFENVRTIGKSEDNPEIHTSYQKEVRKGLDEILLSSGVSEMEFELIKKGSRKRGLSVFKLAYARKALEANYTLKEIGNNIKISDVAIVDMLKRNNLIT